MQIVQKNDREKKKNINNDFLKIGGSPILYLPKVVASQAARAAPTTIP